MTGQQRIERARRAKAAMTEFLDPALAEIEADYAEKMISAAASPDPRAPEIIARLANGVKIARQIRARIEAQIADGAMEQADVDRAGKLDEMTPPKRRLLAIGA